MAKILKKAAETDLVVTVPDYSCTKTSDDPDDPEGSQTTSCVTQGDADLIDADTASLDQGLPPFSLPVLFLHGESPQAQQMPATNDSAPSSVYAWHKDTIRPSVSLCQRRVMARPRVPAQAEAVRALLDESATSLRLIAQSFSDASSPEARSRAAPGNL